MSSFIKRTVVLVTMTHKSSIKLHKPHKASLSQRNWHNQLYILATEMGLWGCDVFIEGGCTRPRTQTGIEDDALQLV